MLSADSRGNKKAYAFVSNMANIAYLVGFARRISRDPKNPGFELQQTNNLNLMLPISIGRKTRIPNDLQDGEAIKVIAHIYGTRLSDGERTCIIEAIDFERPNLLEMPPSQAWSQFVPQGAPTDTFNPFMMGAARDPGESDLEQVPDTERERIRLGKNANLVYLAGFVDSCHFALDSEGKAQRDCLVLLLRQHEDQDTCISVRHYGKYAAPYRKTLSEERKSVAQIGFPLLVEGRMRVKVKPLAEAKPGEITPVQRLVYVDCPHPLVATPKEIRARPLWMTELFQRAVAAKRDTAAAEAQAQAVTAAAASGTSAASPSAAAPAPAAEAAKPAQAGKTAAKATAKEGAKKPVFDAEV